ncbi:MAG: hypothetical protein ACLSA6_05550 [Holdemania massiliensis]
MLEAYPDYFVVYTRGDEELCQMVRWDEVQNGYSVRGKPEWMLVVRVVRKNLFITLTAVPNWCIASTNLYR